MNKLIDQAGFPHASFAYCGDNLAMARTGLSKSLIERLEFRIPSDKLGESTRHGSL